MGRYRYRFTPFSGAIYADKRVTDPLMCNKYTLQGSKMSNFCSLSDFGCRFL